MAAHKVAVIAGDGIGREVVPEGVRVLEKVASRFGLELAFTDFPWSCEPPVTGASGEETWSPPATAAT